MVFFDDIYSPTPPLLVSCRTNVPEGKQIQLVYIDYITHSRSVRIIEKNPIFEPNMTRKDCVRTEPVQI